MHTNVSHGNTARSVALLAAGFILAAPCVRVFAQHAVTSRASLPAAVAGIPTARSLAYPQSVYVDSQNGNVWVTDFDNNRVLRFDVSTLTGIAGRVGTPTAAEYGLRQNYPNPFNPSTTITFVPATGGHATVKVLNMLGQEVATLFDGAASAHTLYSLRFDATNRPSGMYVYVLRSADRLEVRKMCVVK